MKTCLPITGMCLLLAALPLKAQTADFIDVASIDAATLKVENGASISAAEEAGAKVLRLNFPQSKSYPGVDFPAPDGVWNLSGFRAISVDVTNESGVKAGVAVRVENPGDWQKSPWNTEVVWLDAGASGTVVVTFGQSFGKPGFALDPAEVKKVKVFVNPVSEAGSLIIHQIRAIDPVN